MQYTFDYRGDRSFTTLLTAWSRELGRPHVDLAHRKVWFLREDGTAHAVLDWTRAKQPLEGREWFVDGYAQCRDGKQVRGVTAEPTKVALTVGHCWVEPVEIDGERWDVTEEDQFGWGGRIPRGIGYEPMGTRPEGQVHGAVNDAGDGLVYVDDDGGRLTLVPEGYAWTVERSGCA